MQQITERISANLVERQCFLGHDPENMSPWGPCLAYQVCGAHMCSPQESSNSLEVVKSLIEALLTMDIRWNVAGGIRFLFSLPALSVIR
jgi:hypothetical protein